MARRTERHPLGASPTTGENMRSLLDAPWRAMLLMSIAGLAMACEGATGPQGVQGAAGTSCVVKDNGDKTKSVTCDGTTVTWADGKIGTDGTSCTIKDGTDGTKIITCGDTGVPVVDGKPGANGTDGKPCAVKDNGNGTATITCADGTVATVSNGTVGADGKPCTVKDNGDGSKSISCADGTTSTVSDGKNGADGKNGVDGATGADGKPGANGAVGATGAAGADGKPCTIKDNGNGTKTITCADGTTVTLNDGAKGTSAAQLVNIAVEMPTALITTIDSVTVAAKTLVKFTVKDAANRGVVGLLAGATGQLRFGLTKLEMAAAGSGDPDGWKSYVNTKKANTAVPPVNFTVGTTDRLGALLDNGDGTYVYTFSLDLTAAVDPVTAAPIPFVPTLTHRAVIQASGTISGSAMPPVNATYDFVPAGGAVASSRLIVKTANCNECHGNLKAHGSRFETKYCIVCHNPGSTDPTTGNVVDFTQMVHGIHSAAKRLADGAPDYKVAKYDFAEVTYPQGLDNCRKCHDGADLATPQGDNWKTRPSKQACGSCHAKTDFATHKGGQATNKNCQVCHTPTFIEDSHQSENDTPNNPGAKAGAYLFSYELKGVTVNAALQPVVVFRIIKDTKPLVLAALPADLTGSPSFLVAYSASVAGTPAIADWNQLGKAAAQPATISIANVIDGTKGVLSGPDVDGFYTATLTDPTAAYPATSTMRAIALQGYYSQKEFGGAGLPSLARHTVSVFKGVTGDPVRRSVVDPAKCANCHEWFEGHGGNRVYETNVCLVCHNPNLSSSGRGGNPVKMSAADKLKTQAAGYDPENPLTFPEESMNFKELIHSIHSSGLRASPYRFVRDRGNSGLYFYDFSEVTFPGVLNNCQTCHKPGTYGTELPGAVTLTTDKTTDGVDINGAAVIKARTTVPNLPDLVSTPTGSACASCHNSTMATAHMKQNGSVLRWQRGNVAPTFVETCTLCHGKGRVSDVELMHAPK